MQRVLRKVAVVENLPAAQNLIAQLPDVVAVTHDGDILSDHFAAGGSSATPTLIEVQSAIDDAERRLTEASHACERLRFAQSQLDEQHRQGRATVEVTLARLHESDAAMAALAEELGQLSSTARSGVRRSRAAAARPLQMPRRRVTATSPGSRTLSTGSSSQPKRWTRWSRTMPSVTGWLIRPGSLAVRRWMLGSRCGPWRSGHVRWLVEQMRCAGRLKANARRAYVRSLVASAWCREARTAAAVQAGGTFLADLLERSIAAAARERSEAEAMRTDAEAALSAARASVRALTRDFESFVDAAHRDEIARAEQQMRVEALEERAMAELGLEAEVLLAEYGPDQPVPVLAHEDGTAFASEDEKPEPVSYVRERQEKRLRAAERELGVLGRVNPLALEEFDALESRHQFLSEQLEDLRKTRRDLLEIIVEVDNRVQQVFAEAYTDIAAAFERVFARLFPGGEGRLILTEPGNWLTTGVDVEARPPGKKIKRLSLLSGGERALVAVSFLISLFIARPSPFYILDEVEAALDDTNLGRLLEIYEELRATSQLLVITHQKRTMEIADALYGVSMRGDGVSTVISSRLRETESVA